MTLHKDVKNVKVSKEGDSKRKHKKSPKVEEPVSECEYETTVEEESSSSEEEEVVSSEEDDDKVSFSTTDILANDPLYFVLSKIFMTEDNTSLATLLQQLNNKLDILIQRNKQ